MRKRPGRGWIFAGTGINGLEALSRGAAGVIFVERDFRLTDALEQHLQEFGVADQAVLARADVYRWAERYEPPPEPVNVFLSPPFNDLERRPEALLHLLETLQQKVAPGSVLVLQSETHATPEPLPLADQWERRRYGRNELLIWVRGG